MIEYPDFEQNFYSRTSHGLYKIAHDSKRKKRRYLCYVK